MSMIILCDSLSDLRRFGMRRAADHKIADLNNILKQLELNTDSWSCDTFGSLCDHCFNSIVYENGGFGETSLCYFLNEIIPFCKKIALFYCRPLSDKSRWIICGNRDGFFKNIETVIRNDCIDVTVLFDNADLDRC